MYKTLGTSLAVVAIIANVFVSTANSQCPSPAPPPIGDTMCYSGPGCLDVTFDYDGILVPERLGTLDTANKIMVQPDGKIVTVGESYPNSYKVARFNPDGSYDVAFGDVDPLNPWQRLGYTLTIFSGMSTAPAGALQMDGKIIAAGAANANSHWQINRYNTDGTLDTTFDGDGKATVNLAGDAVQDIAIQSNGKIVLVGSSYFTTVRLNANGSLDTTYGSHGIERVEASSVKGGGSKTFSVAIQTISGEERIVSAGQATAKLNGVTADVWAIMRFKSNGAIDTTFGSSGRVFTNFSAFNGQIRDVQIDSSNRIVAGGYTNQATCNDSMDFAMARYTTSGALDATFSGDGKVTADFYGGQDVGTAFAIQPDGKYIQVGYVRPNGTNNNNYDNGLVRYNADGTPDITFGPGFFGPGIVTTSLIAGKGGEIPTSVAVQPDGKLIMTGHEQTTNSFDIIRYLP